MNAQVKSTAVTPFNFESQVVRTVLIEDEPWFVAEDICKALSLSSPTMSLKALDEDERSKLNLGRQGQANIISESGMYTLVLRCRDAVKPGTRPHRFRKWVTSEVLPSIRKNSHFQGNMPNEILPDDAVIFSEGRVQQLYWHAWRSYKMIMQQELDHGINEDTLRLHNTWRSMYPRQIVDGIQRDLMLTCYKGLTDKIGLRN